MTRPSVLVREPVAQPPGRTGIGVLGVALAYAAAFTTPWNGMYVAGLRPGDLCLFLALVVLGVAGIGRVRPSLPPWVWIFGAAVTLVTALNELRPTDPHYLAHRLVVDAGGRRIGEIETNLGVGAKFLVPAVVLPLVFAWARSHDSRAPLRAALWFAAGSALSGLIGFTDDLGITALSKSITGLSAGDGRAPGLSVHPNFLAITCVISVPVVLWRLAGTGTGARLRAGTLLVLLVLGIYASGSRGGAGVLVVSLVLCCGLIPQFRRHLATLGLLAVAAVTILFVSRPELGRALLDAVRLGDNGSAAGSDYVRSAVQHQGWLDFLHSPFDGIGLQVAAQAHDVYLQALASGGLLLTAGYVAFLAGAICRAVALRRTTPLAEPLLVSTVAVALLSAVENGLTDRLTYVPMALLAAMPLPRGHAAG